MNFSLKALSVNEQSWKKTRGGGGGGVKKPPPPGIGLRELVQKFPPDYFVVAETKLDCSFPDAQF